MLRSVFRLLLHRGTDNKRWVCWITGQANSGKSEFIRRLGQIFASDDVDWKGKYLPVNKTNRPEIQTQLVTCEEFNRSAAFNQQNFSNTKMLFQGTGASVQENLFAQHTPAYPGAVFVLASNALPCYEYSGFTPEQFQKDVWAPIKARTDLIFTTESHDRRKEFPYSAAELAHALAFLARHSEACESLRELDETEAPSGKEDSIEWHREQAEQQQ